jgi:iron complex transport system permease protein
MNPIIYLAMNRTALLFIFLPIALAALFFADLALGSVHIPIADVIAALTGGDVENTTGYIVQSFRLPKAIAAVLAGSAIAVAGLHMQTLFNNPLADTSILGIGHGSSLGVAIFVLAAFMLPGLIPQQIQFSNWGIVAAAVIGAGTVLFLVLSISVWLNDTVSLLLAGIMIGFISGSLVSILQYMSEPELIKSYLVWTFGSLAGVTWPQLKILAPLVGIGLAISVLLAKSMNAFLLGENYASSVGVNVKFNKRVIVGATSLLAGSVTAFTGPIAFIGIAVPHFARMAFGTTDHRILFPACIICGAGLMLFCDIVSQMPGSGGGALPINAVTSLIGAPLVLYIVIKNRKSKTAFSA